MKFNTPFFTKLKDLGFITLMFVSLFHSPSITGQELIVNQQVFPASSFEKFYLIAKRSRPRDAQDVLARQDSSNKHVQAMSRQPEVDAGRDIVFSTSDFTEGNDLTRSILNFLKQTVQDEGETLSCVNPKRLLKGEETVYLTDKYAVKVFPDAEKYFYKISQEISGLDLMKQIPLQEGGTIDFITAGRCVIDGKNTFLLMSRRVPGQTIKSYLDEIYTASNKQKALNDCKVILSKFGRLLGEIHSKTAIFHSGDSEAILEITFKKYVRDVYEYLERYQKDGGEDYDLMKQYFEQVINNYDKSGFYFTISHNDTHLENFLFDWDKGMTVIDTPRVHYTANADGEPLFASYLHDIGRVEDDIAKWVLYHEINDELIFELQEAFHQGYRQTAKQLINPSQMFADKAWTMLTRLRSVIKYKHEKETPNGRIYQYYSDFFKKKPFKSV